MFAAITNKTVDIFALVRISPPAATSAARIKKYKAVNSRKTVISNDILKFFEMFDKLVYR